MTAVALDFPTASYRLELPAEGLGALRRLFPRAAAAADAGAPAAERHFEVAERGGAWSLSVGGVAAGRFASLGHALLALEHRLLADLARPAGGRPAFHAGAVDVGGTACLVAGPPETGKSSSTVQLVELGHLFLADEIAIVEPAAGEVLPLPRTPGVGSGFAADLRSLGDPVAGRLIEIVPSVTRYAPHRLGDVAVAVSTLVLPRYRRGAALEVRELEAGRALPEVLGYCFEPAGDQEVFLDRLIGLLERWSIHRLTYGDAAAARRALAALFPPPARPGAVGAVGAAGVAGETAAGGEAAG